VPHINQLVDKYAKKGFVVVGVTDEPEGPTMKYMEDTGWKAIVAFEPGSASMAAYGFKGYPSGALVNAKGEVVWTGHPSEVDDSMIEKYLQGARVPGAPSVFADLKPDLDAPKKYQATAKKIAGGQVGAGLLEIEKALAGKIGDEDKAGLEAMTAELNALYDGEMKAADEALEAKRYFDAKFGWTRLEKAFKGHPKADDPKQKLADLGQDATIGEELAAGAEIQKALMLREKEDLAGAVKALKRVTGGPLKATAEAARAAKLIEEIEAETKGSSRN
jgi:Redoxin